MAKSRKGTRLRKREKTRRQRLKGQGPGRSQLQDYKQRLEADLLKGRKVVVEPRGVAKMSEVLEAFVEPFLDHAHTEDATRTLLMLAVLEWNASGLPEEEQRKMVMPLPRFGAQGIKRNRAISPES